MKDWLNERVSENIVDQLYLMAASMLAGVFLCLVYDIFRSFRRVRQLKRMKLQNETGNHTYGECPVEADKVWLVGLEDVVWCVFFLVTTYIVFYFFHDGAVAGYTFLGEVTGALIYYGIFHNWIRCVFTCFFWQLCILFTIIKRVIAFPFRLICGKMIKHLKNLAKSIKMVVTNH